MPIDSNHVLGARFFKAQDLLRGGPDPVLCTSGYEAQIGGNPPMSLAGHQQFARMFYAAFPDIVHTIEETVADEDRVVVRFTLRGTHQENFLGLPPTGKPIDIGAIAILRIEDGQVAGLRALFDEAGMMRQLGVS
jgi:steroid delta-isomerase-like uncharacterized protein